MLIHSTQITRNIDTNNIDTNYDKLMTIHDYLLKKKFKEEKKKAHVHSTLKYSHKPIIKNFKNFNKTLLGPPFLSDVSKTHN